MSHDIRINNTKNINHVIDPDFSVDHNTQKMVMNVRAEMISSLNIIITYDDNMIESNIVSINDIVKVSHICDNKIDTITGRIISLEENFIEVDYSKEFISNKEKILISEIRKIQKLL